MTERAQVLFLQIVGTLVLAGVLLVTATLVRDYPVPVALIGSLVSALIGKLFGESLPKIAFGQVDKLLSSAPPPLAAAVAKRAIESLPPSPQLDRIQVVLTGYTSHPPPPGMS